MESAWIDIVIGEIIAVSNNMKKQKKDPRFKEFGVDCIVDGKRNIIIMRPKATVGVEISWKIPNKPHNLVTNFMIIGNQWHNKKAEFKYKLLLKIIGFLFPAYK